MRNRFETQLLELDNNLVTMGTLCETAISLSVKAFIEGNQEFAKKALEVEDEIDEKEREIEHQCLQLLLQQQPVAKDLRAVSAVLKMITDLERIGDQAADIAELSEYTKTVNTSEHIKKMAEEATKMVTDSIDSFVRNDKELAKQVIAYDDIVDDLFVIIKTETIEQLKKGDEDAEGLIDILMIAKYLERIGDHATNIAGWVLFSITGRHKY